MFAQRRVLRLPFGQAAEFGRQRVQLVHRGFELHGGRLIVGLGLLRVQRLQMLDDVEEQAAQLLQSGQGSVGVGAGGFGAAGGEVVQRRGESRQAVLGVGTELLRHLVALFGGLFGLLVGLLGARRRVPILFQQRREAAQAPLPGEHQVAQQLGSLRLVQLRRVRGGFFRGREQGDDVLLAGVGEFDQTLGIREQLDGVA